MYKKLFFPGVLLAVSVAMAGSAGSYAATRSASDFRVTRVSAFLGDQPRSFIEVRGVISQRALAVPLVPEVDFSYSVDRTCRVPSHPAKRLTVHASYEWISSASWVPVSATGPTGTGSMLGWSKRYAFALPDGPASGFTVATCPAGYAPGPIRIVSAHVTAWPGWNWESPPSGMQSYEFDLR